MESVDITKVYNLMAKTKIFSGHKFSIYPIHNSRLEKECFRIEMGENKSVYKVRLQTDLKPSSIATEYEAFRLLRHYGINWIPQIHDVRHEDPVYLITEYKEGNSLIDSHEWIPYARKIVENLNSTLGDIHSIIGSYFGRLAGPQYSSWKEFLDKRFWDYIYYATRTKLIDENIFHKIRVIYGEACDKFDEVKPTLLHSDIKPGNIIFNSRNHKTILIDFELARFGDIDFDWVKLYYLSLRWQEYSELIANPILAKVNLVKRLEEMDAKLIVYSLYHICSILEFEVKTKSSIPAYRFNDLENIVNMIRLKCKS